MSNDDSTRYTMQAGDVAKRLQCSRETVHNLAETSELSYRTRSRSKQDWRYFDPEEVEALAQRRGVAKE